MTFLTIVLSSCCKSVTVDEWNGPPQECNITDVATSLVSCLHIEPLEIIVSRPATQLSPIVASVTQAP